MRTSSGVDLFSLHPTASTKSAVPLVLGRVFPVPVEEGTQRYRISEIIHLHKQLLEIPTANKIPNVNNLLITKRR